jgi:WD40 repeat protein
MMMDRAEPDGYLKAEFSPDGRLVLAFGGADAQIWDIKTARVVDKINCSGRTQVCAGQREGAGIVTGLTTGGSAW